MYLRWYFESKPAWNGNCRTLFQNNNNQRPAMTNRSVASSHRGVDFLKLIFQRKMATEAIAIRTIQNGQIFSTASRVLSPPPIRFPGPEVFAATANSGSRHDGPAMESS